MGSSSAVVAAKSISLFTVTLKIKIKIKIKKVVCLLKINYSEKKNMLNFIECEKIRK